MEEGGFRYAVRLYEARVDGASDVSSLAALHSAALVPLRKRLLLDLAAMGFADNIEAAAWGPPGPGGQATLLLMSDDNFDARQPTRLLVFGVAGRSGW